MDLGEKKDGILSWFTNSCSSKSNGKLPDKLRESYTIANSLSRYCAYLLVAKPDLTPDSFLVPKIVFQKTVESAHDGILQLRLLEKYPAILLDEFFHVEILL